MIGESLSTGKVLYKDLVSPIAPLAAWMYMLISSIGGRSILLLQILSILLVTYQFSLFNNIMLRNKAYNENSYIPALIYALIMLVFYDFFTLSPALISLTFILLVLDNIYLRIENKLKDSTILKTGFFMGIAVLFYLPSVVFLIATILSFALLTSLVIRRYLLFLYGFLFPFMLVFIYFYWQGGLDELLSQWIKFNLFSSIQPVINLQSILIIAALPSIVFLFALYKTFSATRFTNYQLRVQQVMFIMFLAAFGGWWISEQQAPFELLLFVPSFAFFTIHLILQFKRKVRAEIFTITFSILLISINYALFFENTSLHESGDFNKLKAQNSIYARATLDKDAMIIGGKTSLYMNAKSISTRFYHPELSEQILSDMNEKERMITLYNDIKSNQPEIIIDQSGYFVSIQNRLNIDSNNYTQISNNLFVRVNQN
ncbi:hypothetical protein [Marivirga arenosa]|uniref:Uncharacterized protein n=1 Tax=Marivirga arenosa TaxID=3059076 RepID=A0AA49J9Q9_9BACT|nr:hypothetical protein [Marivirga sp. BKB1-2]WKK82459.2 hypothetical protein QYS47_10635 [Marivirga sp. BKB1-2]